MTRARHRRLAILLIGLLLGFLAAALATPAHATSPREDVAAMVRLLGYGGAIHAFKNYVLRGEHRDEYRLQSQHKFDSVLATIKRLENHPELSAEDRQALAAIGLTVGGYLDGLRRIQSLFEKGWRVEDIDRVVVVDDQPALDGLRHLRAKWKWSEWERIQHHLGYGGAIHHFKNYVLRHNDAYHTQALEHFLAVESLISELLGRADLSARHAASLATVERTSRGYMDYLALVERLIRAQRPIRQIDLAVKINDRPALAAIEDLLEAHRSP